MKIFRIVGLLGILLSVYGGTVKTASASGITCSYTCSGEREFATCTGTIAQCCSFLHHACPFPSVFQGGDCTDGVNHC